MAQRYVTDEGVLTQPGAYPSIKVQKPNSGLATSGIIFLVGEADAGPAWSAEADLSTNLFGPTQLAEVLSKYKSGNLVDAFRIAANAANDQNIVGAPAGIYLVKSNVSAKATGTMLRSGQTAYGTLADTSYGQLGNLTYFSVAEKVSEVAPTTGAFTYIPGPETGASDGAVLALRVNGGAKQTVTVAAQTLPSAVVTALNALSGVLATGGVDRGTLTGIGSGVTLALAATGNSVVITLGTGSWTTTPSVGDTLIIPLIGTYGCTQTSCIVGAANANAGAYVVTAATSNTITATKLANDTSSGAIVAPVNVSAAAIGSETTDVLCASPITVKNATGTDRSFLAGLVGKTLTGSIVNGALKLTLQTGSVWAALPQVGDIVQIPSTAPAAILASNANLGWFVVTAATTGVAAGASTVTLSRCSDGTPSSFSATAIAAVGDVLCLRPSISGVGKALELYDGAGNFNISTNVFTTAGAAVSWLSTSATPVLLTSASEKRVTTSIKRQADGVNDSIDAGGDLALLVGYNGTAATLTIGATTLTTSVSGGNGANLSVTLADYRKLADLAAYINAQTGYTASVATALQGQMSPTVLDEGTYSICSELGAKAGRIKKDAYDFFTRLSQGTATVQFGITPAAAASGLPEAQATTFLAGGSKGATTAAGVAAAITALGSLQGNFVVPLFSRDASADIADGLTDAGSTYTIDAINLAVSSHVLEMSKLKRRRHRQGFCSIRSSFTNAKLAAQNIANYRVSMTYQDVKALGADGSVKQYQPWMGAVIAAGMQAAGFYQAIVFKGVNASGVLMADGSMTDKNDDDLDAAIENGLLSLQRPTSGGIRWNSDQTTYAVDESFVYNSIQAIYASDIVALTVAQRMEKAFVGKSVADVSASVAKSYLQGIMADMKRLKLIAASDDAPLGYRDANIVINGNAMRVSMEIKLAGAILFIPITFLVSQVQQSAA
jgi:hypothetical protein